MKKNQKSRKRWLMCETCYQLVYTAGPGTGQHMCPDIIRARMDAELDMVMEAELSTWEHDLKEFWDSRDVKFWQFQLENKREI